MGSYKPTFLQHLTGFYSTSTGHRIEIQARRLTTLAPILRDILPKVTEIRPPTFDAVIFYRMDIMKKDFHDYAVIYVQSLWRRHLSRRQYNNNLQGDLHFHISIVIISKSFLK